MGNYQKRIDNLIEHTINTFKSNNPKNVLINGRKVAEAFCKIVILHHYGEDRGNNIIFSQDEEWNKKLKVTHNQKRNKRVFVLKMLLQVVLNTHYPNEEISQSKKHDLQRTIELIIFKGNSASHDEFNPDIIIDRQDSIITQKNIIKLLRWLFLKFLKTAIPNELIIYIGKYDIFLSYRHTDIKWVKALESNLKVQGYTIFLDEYQIIAGEEINNHIKNAINKSNCAIIIYPTKSDSSWFRKELEWMREQQKLDNSFNIIPIVTHTSEYIPNNSISYIDFRQKDYKRAFNELICAIKRVPPTKNYIKEPLKIPAIGSTNSSYDNKFVSNLLNELFYERLIVLFSQDFTDITPYYKEIKKRLKAQFGENFYKISIPSFTKNKKKYFSAIAKSCKIKTKVKELQDWKDAIEKRLDREEKILLFVTDLENGNEEYNREFTTTLRNLHYEYENITILLIGRKVLASLVYADGELSPLRSVGKQLFFPNSRAKITSQAIVLEFEKAQPYKKYLCKLLDKKRVKRFSPWYSDEIINQLFWKNLLIQKGNYLVWRSKEIYKIGYEVLGCNNNL